MTTDSVPQTLCVISLDSYRRSRAIEPPSESERFWSSFAESLARLEKRRDALAQIAEEARKTPGGSMADRIDVAEAACLRILQRHSADGEGA